MNFNNSKFYLIGNWKMNNSTQNDVQTFFESLIRKDSATIELGICPQNLQLSSLTQHPLTQKNEIKIGAQNISDHLSGAFTGESSLEAIKDINVDFTLIGHSERRQFFGDTPQTVTKKVNLCLEHNFPFVLCIGENLEEREAAKTLEVIEAQLKSALQNLKDFPSTSYPLVCIAYEPVWAIGTGRTATPDQVREVHDFISSLLEDNYDLSHTPILYGGSVKPSNIKGLANIQSVHGALVGGASLSAESFNQLQSELRI